MRETETLDTCIVFFVCVTCHTELHDFNIQLENYRCHMQDKYLAIFNRGEGGLPSFAS